MSDESASPARTVRFSVRLLAWILIVAAAFGVGTAVYFSTIGSGKDGSTYYATAIAAFPLGFSAYVSTGNGPIQAWLAVGWGFYGLLTAILLIGKRRKTFLVAVVLLVLVAGLNLGGCARMFSH